ncbi:TPA: matrix-binding protein EbhB, partial [Streptococcus suis]|nr:matrix-binding protein EbhB [Streptococcus suis]
RAFDAEFEKRQVAIDTAIEQAQSHGEVYADRLKASIDSELSTIHQQMRQQEEEQQRTTRDLMAKAGVNTNLATEAKQKAEQAQTGATEALRRAEQAKLDAIQEANRLSVTERSQTESKIATAKSQAITEASRLVDVAKSLLGGQLATVSTNLSQTKEDIKLLASKQLVDSLTGRVTGAESMIQVQADQISQRVKTSDFNQAKQRIETAESSITQLGNRITTEISQTVAKIPTSIGGRNLFKGSRDFSDVWYNAGNGSFFEDYKDVHIHRTKTAWLGKSQRISVKSGEIYTFSFYAKSDSENDGIMFYLSHSGTGTPAQGHPNNKYIAISTDYQRYSITFKITSNGIIVPRLERTNTTSFLFFGGFKLETGSISTDWSPAPEDFSNEIESVKTTITQTASGVEQVSTRLTEANGKISSSETQIRQLVSDVSSKVSQTDFNNLKRTVEGHTTSIQQTQQSILLKADKTVLEGVKTTADNALAKANTNASQITQTKADLRIANDAISQKVAKTDFNSLTGRVASAESTIRTQAGQIEQRLTSTQVESAINSKGYQTKSQVDSNITGRGYLTSSSLQPYATTTSVQNLVRTTSDSFTQRIS